MEEINSKFDQYERDFDILKEKHSKLVEINEKYRDVQNACLAAHKHQINFQKLLLNMTKNELRFKSTNTEDSGRISLIRESLENRESELREIADNLPKNNGRYLRTVIGDVNLSLTTKQDKYAYKHDYERFKIFVTAVIAFFSFFLLQIFKSRILDSLFHFVLVWFYCTLTIRERILIINGSRIKGWWYIYHFIMTSLSAIMLVWSNSKSYELFRIQFLYYVLYLQLVHCIQYHYQRGCLYKLRALGSRHAMDITVDGFMSWMFRHLSFVIPFLLFAYIFQFYNACILYNIYLQPSCNEWEPLIEAIIFMILSAGNFTTMGMVLIQKLLTRSSSRVKQRLSNKYSYAGTTLKVADGIRHVSLEDQSDYLKKNN